MDMKTSGIDVSKNIFHVIGTHRAGKPLFKYKFTRQKLSEFGAKHPLCLIDMEACAASQHLARKLYVRTAVRSQAMVAARLSCCGRSKTLPVWPFPARGGREDAYRGLAPQNPSCVLGRDERARGGASLWDFVRECEEDAWVFGATGLSAYRTDSPTEAERVYRDHRWMAEGRSRSGAQATPHHFARSSGPSPRHRRGRQPKLLLQKPFQNDR